MSTASNTGDLERESDNFKVPAAKSVQEILDCDADDESLKKYKEALLGPNGGFAVPFPDDPRHFIPKALRIVVDGETRATVPLDHKGDSPVSVDIIEDTNFHAELDFYAQREIVSGLTYICALYRNKVIRVDKDEIALGSYPPKDCMQTWKSREQTAPSGMLARGNYTAKGRIVDDDNHDHLFEFSLRVVAKEKAT